MNWLRDKTALRQIGNYVEITTPYLDRHNDYMQIFVKKEGNTCILTDDGYIMHDLEQGGCKMDTPKRQELLNITLNGFGVEQREGALQVRASSENFAARKHSLVQAMLAINDLFYLAVPVEARLFYEDVVNWLDATQIRYAPSVKFTGKSGYDHHFDFLIPKSRTRPERILQTINRPNRDMALTTAMAWIDVRDTRPPKALAYAMLNDTEKRVPGVVLDALQNYEIKPVLWTERKEVQEELAA